MLRCALSLHLLLSGRLIVCLNGSFALPERDPSGTEQLVSCPVDAKLFVSLLSVLGVPRHLDKLAHYLSICRGTFTYITRQMTCLALSLRRASLVNISRVPFGTNTSLRYMSVLQSLLFRGDLLLL